MSEEFVIKITDSMSDVANSGGGGSPSSGGGGLVNLGAKIGLGIGLVTQLLSLASDAIGTLLNPIKGILKGIFKLVAELLRPLVTVMISILQPVLIVLKPLIDMFRGFMAPFMAIAKEYQMIARQQLAAGDTTGAMGTSLDAIQSIIGPFIVSAFSVVAQLATTLIVSVGTYLLGNVMDMMGAVLGEIPGFGTKIKEALASAKISMEAGSGEVIGVINGTILNLTEGTLSAMKTDLETKLAEVKDSYPSDYNTAFIETPASALVEIAKENKATADGMEKDTKLGLGNMGVDLNNSLDPDKGTVPTTFKSGLDSMISAVQTFGAKIEAVAEDINAIDLSPTISSSGGGVNIGFSMFGGVTIVDEDGP